MGCFSALILLRDNGHPRGEIKLKKRYSTIPSNDFAKENKHGPNDFGQPDGCFKGRD